MKLFRYMSKNEFDKFMNGETLVNDINHKQLGRGTDSVGFAWLNTDDFDPIFAYEFLYGIVADDILLEVEAPEKVVNKGFGIYASPYFLEIFDTIEIDEYCTTTYNNIIFIPLRYAENKYPQDGIFTTWEWHTL